jgi:centrosomal protein CEP104
MNLPYSVVACSSHDDEYPAEGLIIGDGWMSCKYENLYFKYRFCLFPQSLIIKLNHSCRIKQLKFISHHFCIASRIDISCRREEEGTFYYLGYLYHVHFRFVALQNNSESGYKAREVKTVDIDVDTLYLRFDFHKCHVNPFNLYNQVFGNG